MTPRADILSWALQGIEREISEMKARLSTLQSRESEVRAALNHQPPARAAKATAPQRRLKKLSPEGRQRIREALKRRWEVFHEQKAKQAGAAKPRRRKRATAG